ncbi:MAG: TlyA family RNA methyltransferase [Sphaerochaeta sp.]
MKKVPLLRALQTHFTTYTKDELHAFVICKNVFVDGELVTDPKQLIPEDGALEIHTQTYVSRGGYKLEAALAAFNVQVEGRVFIDAGSSTGGFTDCLLQHGAKAVHAVDVGYNLIDWKLRSDPRVILHEKQNIMTLNEVDPPAEAAVCDLSFRSISNAASHILSLVGNTFLIALIKPQFELENPPSTFDGVIDDSQIIQRVLGSVQERLAAEGVGIIDLIASPITGAKGNREFLGLLQKTMGLSQDEVIQKAREELLRLQ